MRGTAAIIGGGIGGLATAAALAQHGWAVTVFEKEAAPAGSGTALGMWPSAVQALDPLGIGDRIRQVAVRQTVGAFRRTDGSRICTLSMAKLEKRSGDPMFVISRPTLLGILRDAVDPASLRLSTAIEDPAPLRAEHDVVVAADGIFSHTRTALFGDAHRATYTGFTAWRGCVDDMPTQTFTETWGPGSKFGVSPQEGGRTNWYGTIAAPERSFTPGRELATLRELFGGWAEPIPSVLAATSEDDVLRHDIYTVPELPAFISGNVALIGDAAHAMTPDLGRGACEALIDAVALARCLHEAADVPAGLAAYDGLRRRPAQRLARVSGIASRLVHRRPLWLRDRLLQMSLILPTPS
ncbi:2-polyprenyl-6-methoxyphenol hydroxylase-like FAD-dependent oxidoreductase [Allocatelliglobosispora scoriae]|uniref:2-polyprenyl-6-methoxyphenol hydroxylase-like FAD-dependent oxidoreductase n=1 Tax=Allocatelliglobosispora scoriae TaxID=643052 RepID=A0A841BP27_9ACTN|nr:FAD-dependent oxidoreductase [Allocatelliglobosispora scoriae]MBB5868949.1 2-polyprenyl-6-methoxyphenol hydroxylase-like FAD-dependent oxidoreductase [Allocatelliglobosispora scoriae]